MQVGPCRYCGMPVEVDDAMLGREWTRALHGLDPHEAEVCQEAIQQRATELAPQVNHQRCIDDFRDRGAMASRLKEQTARAVRYSRACPFKGDLKTNLFDLKFRDKDAVMSAFHVAKRSVTMAGTTGRGKTRIAWLLVEQPFIEGKSVRVFTHTSLKGALDEKSRLGRGEMSAFVRALVDCDVLLIDDLGQADMCRYENSLLIEEQTFHILDSRLTDLNKRTILTTQFNRETLAARMSPERGAAMVRRILELTVCFADWQA